MRTKLSVAVALAGALLATVPCIGVGKGDLGSRPESRRLFRYRDTCRSRRSRWWRAPLWRRRASPWRRRGVTMAIAAAVATTDIVTMAIVTTAIAIMAIAVIEAVAGMADAGGAMAWEAAGDGHPVAMFGFAVTSPVVKGGPWWPSLDPISHHKSEAVAPGSKTR